MLVAKVRVKGGPLHSKLLIFLIITGLVNGMTSIVKELRAPCRIKGRQIWTQALSSLVSLWTHSVPRHSVIVTEITQQGRSQSPPPPTLTISAYSYKSPMTDHTCTREPKSPSELSQKSLRPGQTSRWAESTQCSPRRACTSAQRARAQHLHVTQHRGWVTD